MWKSYLSHLVASVTLRHVQRTMHTHPGHVHMQGKKGPQGQTLDVYANFDHYGTRDCLAGLIRGDMHKHPFRSNLEEVSGLCFLFTLHASVNEVPELG